MRINLVKYRKNLYWEMMVYMDIKQLKYFRAIVEEGNITGAAKRLFMTQPSLSQQLMLLENELAVKLVERGGRKIRLTEAGCLLNDRAGLMLDLLHATATELKELHEGYRGTLAIGTIASSGVTLLPDLIRDFHANYPNVKFQLREGDTNSILDLLNNGVIEIGIVRSVFDVGRYHWINLPPEPMIIAMASTWDAQAAETCVSINKLADAPLLLHRSNETMIREVCQKNGFEPQILCTGDDVRSLLVWANEGFGLAIVPKSALGLVPSHCLRYKAIIDSPLEVKKSVVWMRNRYLSAVAKHFLDRVLSGDLQSKE